MFITIEGADGVGKSTQARMLADKLRENPKYNVLEAREPHLGGLGELAHAALLTATPLEALYLLAAARSQHIREVIRPHLFDPTMAAQAIDSLLRGRFDPSLRAPVVVCDRYLDSTWAYQVVGNGRDVADAFITAIKTWLLPDITIILDATEEVLEARLRERRLKQPRFQPADAAFALDDKFAARRRAIMEAFRSPIQVPGRLVRTIDVSNLGIADAHLAVWRAFQSAAELRLQRARHELGLPSTSHGAAA